MSGVLALALSGGGAPAAYFGAGVIRAVEETGQRPNILSGVSAGAINACAYGVGLDAAELADMWTQVGWSDIYRPRLDLWRAINVGNLLRPTSNIAEYALDAIGWTWLLDTAPARRTLTRFLGDEFAIPATSSVVVSSVDENTGEVVRFCSALPPAHRRGPEFRHVRLDVHHVLASAAVPLLFPPGRDGGGTYVDAGLVANTPLAPALAFEPDQVIVVSGGGISRPAPTPSSLGDAISLLVDNVARFALMSDYRHAQTVNTMARAAPHATVKRDVPILLIEPAELGFSVGGFLRFTAEDARTIMAYGYETAAKALAGWSP